MSNLLNSNIVILDTQNTVSAVIRPEKTVFVAPQGSKTFIAYSAYPDGTGFSIVWDASKTYMGIATGFAQPNAKESYEWVRIIGNTVSILEDNTTEAIYYIAETNIDKTYSANNITSLTIVIPEFTGHGYYTGLNIKSNNFAPIVFINESSLPLKLLQYGMEIPSITMVPNTTVLLGLFSDGINVYCYINEV